jgi:hypothetical protein
MSIFSPLNKDFRLKREIQEMIDKSIEESKRKGAKKSEEVTTKQQILILHYLGVIQAVDLDDSRKAFLFSKLLNRDCQNIREYLGHVNGLKVELSDIKTKRNLEIVRDIFLELKMTKETNLINKDLEVLEKKK